MQISQATPADITELCALLSSLFAQELEFLPDAALQAQGLAEIILHPEVGVILVARAPDGHVSGMVNLLFTVSTALGARVALLEDLVVAPKARGAGIGSQLLSRAIALAKDKGCKRITLLTDADNDGAQRLYARLGFAMSGMVPMRLPLV